MAVAQLWIVRSKSVVDMKRPLTAAEADLIRWMLEHGAPEARAFLPQLQKAQVTPWRCSCGCASIHFSVDGLPEPSGGVHPIADFLFWH